MRRVRASALVEALRAAATTVSPANGGWLTHSAGLGGRLRGCSSSPVPGGDGVGAAGAGGAGSSPPRLKELYMVFTCGRCNTRAVKGFSKRAYEHGVVLVDCPGCNARHVVADRAGWFGAKGSVEDFLAEKGEAVKWRGGEDALEFTPEELAGNSSLAGEQKPGS
jgi:mitochondrial protein import protein ZIM17